MRTIIAIAATSIALVGCGSLGSSNDSSSTDVPCVTIVTKTGVVEQCS